MISHTTLGTSDLAQAETFYDGILVAVGGKKTYQSDNVIFWQFEKGGAKLAITVPYDGKPASSGNGTMVAFTLESINQVQELYAKAIALGGQCEGEPGKRNDGAFYGAYFRDLDGNKIAIFYRE